jgi:lipopolysaccharide biosynthesis glycosyltransferase
MYLVASAFDDKYLWPWACSAFSAIRSGGQPPNFLIANVDGLLSPRGEELVLRTSEALGFSAEIVPLKTPTWDVHYTNQWNATVFARLLLLDQLSERFLWLDSDTLVLNGWQEVTERSEDLFAASDVIACAVRDCDATLAQMAEAGTNEAFIASRGNYVNSGIFVADPQRWRAEGLHDRWMDVVATQSRRGFEYVDQDVLNLVLAGRIGILPRAYNHIVAEPAMGDERVLHFAGYPKPWKLSPDSQAFFMASEALNAERPSHQISGGGTAWQLFPLYWQIEREFTERLTATGHEQLRDALLAIRATNVEALEPAASVKLRLMRLLATKMRGS